MNREIKFRVWDNVDYMSSSFTINDLQTSKVQFTSDCVVMQYTGLKDKNGVDIYEGDFVGHAGAYIVWSEKLYCWCFKFNNDNIETPLFYDDVSTFKVIGNIYENPELLK